MATDFEQGTRKTIDLTIKAEHLTSDILKAAMQEFLSGDVKKGRMSLRQLEQQSQGKIESIEVTDNNIRDFLETAKKYDVDFALKRDNSTQPPTYHVFFAAAKTEDFKRAFSEYASRKQAEVAAPKRGEITREQLKQQAQTIAQQPKAHHKERVRANEVAH
ncbi:MAG: PcfB family protein [Ruminococcus sp.]|nr:PcfB family protein [Ruminococcus sp.]